MNQRWSVTFGANNLLQPDTIAGDYTIDSRYVSNQGPDHMPLWDQVDLSNGVKNRLPFSNLVAATAPAVLVGRRSTSAGDFEEITLGAGLAMSGQSLSVDLSRLMGSIPIPDEPQQQDPWPVFAPTFAPIYGTWAPVIGGTGGTSGQAYSLQAGTFVKFGRQVTLWFVVVLTAKGTITGDVEIQGFPFAITNTVGIYRSVCAVNWFQLATTHLIIQGGCVENTSTMFLRSLSAAAATMGNTMSTTDIADDSAFSGTYTYLTDQ